VFGIARSTQADEVKGRPYRDHQINAKDLLVRFE
jgi:hypothetical protein